MDSKVYVVMGTTGEYSDRTEWPVCAYLEESLAQEHITKATARAKEIEVLRGDRYLRAPDGVVNEYDPDMSMDYTGTDYYCIEVELRTTTQGSPHLTR